MQGKVKGITRPAAPGPSRIVERRDPGVHDGRDGGPQAFDGSDIGFYRSEDRCGTNLITVHEAR